MALIEFRGVQKAFGPKVVYRGLDLDVYKGESLTILGGSGQGKSVMLKLLIGLLEVDAGSIKFDGIEVTKLRDRERAEVRRRIGMLFQGAALFDSLTVRENVAYGLREHGRPTEREIDEVVARSLGYVGLPGIESMWPADLSGGMRKRVGLARTIALAPEVVLYDEPTTGLDPINTTRINKLINHLKRTLSITSVVVTHDMGTTFTVSDRIVMVHEGNVIFEGTPEQIRRATDPRIANFISGTAPDDDDERALLVAGA
jgi:phospholipid/cholesterol/gamma-HCH transport system ATP-binding protein